MKINDYTNELKYTNNVNKICDVENWIIASCF